jgi:ADP-heptose:LPS heptosyltransferase
MAVAGQTSFVGQKLIRMANLKKILIVKYGGLGDHVFSSATIKHIRRLEPNAHITVLPSARYAELYANNPYINLVVPAPEHFEFVRNNSIDYSVIDGRIGAIRDEDFDYLYNPSHDYDLYLSGLVVSRISAKQKIGFRQFRNMIKGYDSNNYYSELLDRPRLSHIADYQNVFSMPNMVS